VRPTTWAMRTPVVGRVAETGIEFILTCVIVSCLNSIEEGSCRRAKQYLNDSKKRVTALFSMLKLPHSLSHVKSRCRQEPTPNQSLLPTMSESGLAISAVS
jgi:hypothetical protein